MNQYRFALRKKEELRSSPEVIRFYTLVDHQDSFNLTDFKTWIKDYLWNPVIDEWIEEDLPHFEGPSLVVEFLPGVTDQEGLSGFSAIHDNDTRVSFEKLSVHCGRIYLLEKGQSVETNPLLHRVRKEIPKDFFSEKISIKTVRLTKLFETFSLDNDLEQWQAFSQQNCWALDAQDLEAIRTFFKQHKRESLPQDPTDVEMEILAQTWSEHCKHRIFAASIEYSEEHEGAKAVESKSIESLFKTYIKGLTEAVKRPWTVSLFSDNAGVVRFDDFLDVAIKVETHNSPSALDPYGGALTGILGVNRDILGVGRGAKPIANIDAFCLAPYGWNDLPEGLKSPKEILEGVHLGVEHGGNKSGIPTINGSFTYDYRYGGKPLVYCGTIGVLPHEIQGTPSSQKEIRSGDYVVMGGGRVGKDGIHGATFSSMELSEGIPPSVVQIGDPLTQKRLLDFTLAARDQGLYRTLTDNGAGGLSSSVGEMAELCGGASLDLAKVPLKYPGLLPFEIMVSESQERMTYAVPPENWDDFSKLAQSMGVEVSHLGEFTQKGNLEVFYDGTLVADLPLEFLHEGVPQYKLKAHWQGPKRPEYWFDPPAKRERPKTDKEWESFCLDFVNRLNIRSHRKWVERYDQEVQGATVFKPFQEETPMDGGLVWLAPHGGEKNNALVLGHGLYPWLSDYDPYLMAQWSLDEAVRSCVAVGANPEEICLVDNFCWPDPLPGAYQAQHKLGQLVRTCEGLYDLGRDYQMPFVSGKDSMKNDFRGQYKGKEITISVPPTLLVTALGRVPDLKRRLTSRFQREGDYLYLLGKPQGSLLASEWDGLIEGEHALPKAMNGPEAFKCYQTYYSNIPKLSSGHDVSRGGLFISLVESVFGTGLAFEIDSSFLAPDNAEILFHEGPGRILCSSSTPLEDSNFHLIGRVTQGDDLNFGGLRLSKEKLFSSWEAWNE